MHPNARMSEQLALLDQIAPISQGVGAVSTGWVSAANFERIMAVIQTGVLGAAATLDGKLQQATDAAGTGVKDIAGKAIVQIVKATGDGKLATIDLRDDELDVTNGFGFVRLTLTVGAAASLIGASLLGGVARYAPPKDAGSNPAINLGSANVVQQIP